MNDSKNENGQYLFAGALGIAIPAVIRFCPKWDQSLSPLAWQIPLGVLACVVAARVLLAPYWIYAAHEKRMVLIRVINDGNQIITAAWGFREEIWPSVSDYFTARAEAWNNLAIFMLKRHAPTYLPVYEAPVSNDQLARVEPPLRAVVIGWTTERVRRLNSIMDSLSATDKAGLDFPRVSRPCSLPTVALRAALGNGRMGRGAKGGPRGKRPRGPSQGVGKRHRAAVCQPFSSRIGGY